MEKNKPFDIVCLTLITVSFSINFLIFFTLLIEQINTGWGYPTKFEMLVLLFWLIQAMTIPIIIIGIINFVIGLIKKHVSKIYIVNTVMNLLTIVMLILSIIFEFN